MKNINPYDSKFGGKSAIIRTTIVRLPKQGRPYETTKPIKIVKHER